MPRRAIERAAQRAARGFAHQPDAHQRVARLHRVPVAVGAARVERPGVPGAAAAHLVVAIVWPRRIVHPGACVAVFGVPVRHPFPHVAVHVVQAERIGREAGWSAARYMLLSAEAIHADELVGGFVHRLGNLEDAMTWAHEMSLLAPLTIKAHKMALERLGGADISLEAVEHARLNAWASNDANEGRQAFLEKRQPNFLGS